MSEEEKKDAPAADAAEAKEDDKKDVVVPEKFAKLVDEIEQMSVLDLAELVSILEDKFGVSAAAPMMMAGGAAGGGEAEAAEEKSAYDVELTAAGDNKIGSIKAVREATSLGLKEAKELVDAAPSIIAEGVKTEDAEAMKAKLEEAGATVTLK